MSEHSLHVHYKTQFSLIQHHGWSGEYLDGVTPFERDLYVKMLEEYLREKKRDADAPMHPSMRGPK